MKLYDCYTKEEKELENIQLLEMKDDELIDLAEKIKHQFEDCILQDERIVVSALHQIIMEQKERIPIREL